MTERASSTDSRRKPWAVTFFGLLAIAALIAMPFLAGPPEEGKMPDIVRFFGRFHPALLHLPIGVFALILIQELGAIFGRRGDGPTRTTSIFPMFFGAASAIVAVIAGFLLYHGENYGGNAVAERHMWGGLAFAVAAVVTFLLKAWSVSLAANPAYYRLLLFASVGVMGFSSHDGATLTHGSGYLTEYAPEPLRKLLGEEEKPEKKPIVPVAEAQQLVFADIVAPILERRCVECHKESKAKGRFRMDTYDLLVKGGKEGAGLEPGNSAESNIVVRMELPLDDDEHMPPENKPDIEEHELMIVKWWIDNGADPLKPITDFVVPAPIQEAIAKLPAVESATLAKSEAAEPPAAPAGPDAALVESVAKMSAEFPGALTFESQGSALLTFTAVSLRGNLDDAAFKKLAPFSSQLATLDLSATKVTDQAVAQLAGAKNLRLIRLAETGITDAAIDMLAKIPSLESINLYGTKVTDAGVAKLVDMPNLKRLYLWQTAVTPEGIKALQSKLPSCEIITGIDS